jgi:hypothetical protein
MAYVITQNSALAATGVIFQGKVDDINMVVLDILDNGGGSTVTFESSADNTNWSNLTTGVYVLSNGNMAGLGGATTTNRGKFFINVEALTYLRIRVTTYVSGSVRTSFELSTDLIFRIRNMLQTGLVAQGNSQASALPLQAVFNMFATVAASTGAILPTGVGRGREVVVRNGGANALSVFPPVAGHINGGTVNASVNVAAGAVTRFISDGDGNYWTV